MDNPILYQVGGILAVLAFLVFLFFCARTWRIWHILFTFAVMGCAVWFCIMAAITLKTRVTFRTQHDRLVTQLEEKEKEFEMLLHGDLTVVRQQVESIRSIRGKLERELLDRGRVWRSCVPTSLANGVVTLTTTTTDPAGAAPPAPAGGAAPAAPAAAGGNQLAVNDVLHGFLERETPDGPEPWLYLGEFTATAVTPTSVTLQPIVKPDPVQVNGISNSQGTKWSLYETLPTDGHRAFALDREYVPNLDVEDESLFGDMDEAKIREIFAQPQQRFLAYLNARLQNAPPDQKARVQKLIDDVQKRFAQTITNHIEDGKVVAPGAGRDPEDLWVKVRFLQKWSIDVDAATNLDAINTDSYFDVDGRAQVEDLQRGERDENGNFQPAPAEFEPEDLAVFDKETADQLVRDGIVEEVDSVYLRGLDDFNRAYHNHTRRMNNLGYDILLAQRDIDSINVGIAKTNQEIKNYEDQKTELDSDLVNVTGELKAVRDYYAQLQKEEARLRTELSNLYKDNRKKAQRLRDIHDQIKAKAEEEPSEPDEPKLATK